eukprot:638414-Pelagomonas_calceolata.AAC.1
MVVCSACVSKLAFNRQNSLLYRAVLGGRGHAGSLWSSGLHELAVGGGRVLTECGAPGLED